MAGGYNVAIRVGGAGYSQQLPLLPANPSAPASTVAAVAALRCRQFLHAFAPDFRRRRSRPVLRSVLALLLPAAINIMIIW